MGDESTYERRRTSFGSAAGAGGAESEQVAAAEYDAVRPDWPVETMSWLVGDPPAGTKLQVVDLGAGTGKGTRTLARLGHAVVAVEPSAGMRSVLAASLPGLAPGMVEVRAGDAEHLPLPDGGVDAVVALQAWHWFDQEAAARECARVLRPGGLLSLAWHHRDESLPWARELSEAVSRSEHIQDGEAGCTPDPEQPELPAEFLPAQSLVVHWTMRQGVEDLVRHAATWSFVAVSPDRERMLQRVREIADGAADVSGAVEMPMTTTCYRARRR